MPGHFTNANGKRLMRRSGSLATGTREATSVQRRTGIKRQPRNRLAAGLPISERHQELLDEMAAGEVIGATTLMHRLEISHGAVVSALYALQDRGLVERVPYRGWRRIK